jgi:hypothetical protein
VSTLFFAAEEGLASSDALQGVRTQQQQEHLGPIAVWLRWPASALQHMKAAAGTMRRHCTPR